MKTGKTVYIGFGSNQGRRQKTIETALRDLSQVPGVALENVSPLYQTQSVGGPSQPDHYNGVARFRVSLGVKDLLRQLKRIERRWGRDPKALRWGPRSIDLDILTYGKSRLRSQFLTIPHPRYHLRRFVLVPFTRLAPAHVHPILRQTNKELLRRLTPQGQRVTILARWKKDQFYRYKRRKKPANP